MKNSRFHKGSATFSCSACHRLTRHTGVQSLGNKICPQCYELAGIENEISDGYATLTDRLDVIKNYVEEIVSKGGNVQDWISTFGLTS